jgi:hypothetical protein
MHDATIITLAIALSVQRDLPIGEEVCRTTDGAIIAVANTARPYGALHMGLWIPGEAEDPPYTRRGWSTQTHNSNPSVDIQRLSGPIPWGVIDGAYYSASHRRPYPFDQPGSPELIGAYARTIIDSVLLPLPETIETERRNRMRDWPPGRGEEVNARLFEIRQAHGCLVRPLILLISENAVPLSRAWDLTYDLAYTSVDDVIAIAVRQGRMHVWELHDTGDINAPWTAHEPFATPIDGVFRLFRAGDDLKNLYIIDETGAIHAGFGAEHRRIGFVREYHSPVEDTLTLLFEDQMTEKIGILHAALDGTITFPAIEWHEEGHAADFLTELDTERTRAGIARLSEVLREDANNSGGGGGGGGGDGGDGGGGG